MRFDKIDIDSYGVFHQRTFDFSQGNFRLVYGQNENGKSTLLSGIRSLIFGYKRRLGENKLFSNSANVAQGRVSFRLSDGRPGSVFRSWKTSDATETVATAEISGHDVDLPELFDAIGCADRDFFSNFFGFSYVDQATSEKKLRAENLSRVIYGLSVGDADRFERARRILVDRREKLFKATGSTPKLNVALGTFQKAKEASTETNATEEYFQVSENLERRRRESAELRVESDKLRRDAAYCQTLSEAYNDYLQYRDSCRELDELVATSRFERATLEKYSSETERRYSEREGEATRLGDEVVELDAELRQREKEKESRSLSLNPPYVEHAKEIEEVYEQSLGFEEGRVGLNRKESELDKREELLAKKLLEAGAILDVSSSESRNATFETYRRPIEKALWREAQDSARAEAERRQRLEEDGRNKAKSEADARGAERELEQLQAELTQGFGAKDGVVAQSEYETVRNAFSGVENQIESAQKLLNNYRKNLTQEKESARSLVASARDGGLEFDADELEEYLARLERQSEPIGLEELQKRHDDVSRRAETLAQSLTDAEKELEKLQREIQSLDSGVPLITIEDALQKALEARERLWREVKGLLLTQEERAEKFYRIAQETARSYESAVADADRFRDERYDSASVSGEIKALQTQYSARADALAKDKNALTALQHERDSLFAEANQLLARCGFGFCAEWSLSRSVAWYRKWLDQRKIHHQNVDDWNELRELVQRIAQEFRRVVNLADVWQIEKVFDESALPDSIDEMKTVEAVLAFSNQAKTLLERIKKRFAQYEAARQRLRDVRNALATKRDELSEHINSFHSNYAALEKLDAQREAFCATLPFQISEATSKDWKTVFTAFEGIRQWQESVKNFDDARREHDERVDEYRRLEERVDELAGKLGVARTEKELFVADVKKWRETSLTAVTALSQLADAERALSETLKKRQDREERRAIIQRELDEIEKKTGVLHSEFCEFQRAAQTLRQLVDANKVAKNDLYKRVQGFLGDKSFDDCVADFRAGDSETFHKEYDRLNAESQKAREEEQKLNEKIGELRKRREDLLKRTGEFEKEATYQRTLAELRAAIDEYAPVQLALAHLENSMKSFEVEKVPSILAEASQYLSRITGGSFVRIERVPNNETKKGRGAKKTENPADDLMFNEGESVGYRAVFSNGAYRESSELSLGSLDQLLFSIRLALVEEYCRAPGAEPLPVIMDDVFVQYDEPRLKNALELLKEIAAAESRQIILMTHHQHLRSRFSEIVGEEGIVDL